MGNSDSNDAAKRFIERMQNKKYETVYKDYQYGDIRITNVPYLYDGGKLFPDGEETCLSGSVANNLYKLIGDMMKDGIHTEEYRNIEEEEE